jgi:hypothetical protein
MAMAFKEPKITRTASFQADSKFGPSEYKSGV